jgi:hypothetical protein
MYMRGFSLDNAAAAEPFVPTMPWIIDYQLVQEQMRRQHLKSLYYNSGAFGFSDPAAVKVIGWIGPPDSTLKPAAAALARPVLPPYEQNLARHLTELWRDHLPGKAWVMPMSHWAYELDFGSREWLPSALERLDLDPGHLQDRANGAALEFAPEESERFSFFAERLLEMLSQSDFMIAFPDRPVLCTVHHHKQLWWTTTDEAIHSTIDAAVPRMG